MAKNIPTAARGCLILLAIVLAIPLLILGGVGMKTWLPLREAKETLAELDETLGPDAAYVPAPSGAIPAERMELFLELRTVIFAACDDYGTVRKGFDSVESLEAKDPADVKEVGGVVVDLGGASLSITPFLARYFELRNAALLAAAMGLEEYSYIFAIAYHDRLLSPEVRREIFSAGVALSPEASATLRGCLERQLESGTPPGVDGLATEIVAAEMQKMGDDPARLIWQDGLPDAVSASVSPYRERLDQMFCGATAGLEMERGSRRALWIAIE